MFENFQNCPFFSNATALESRICDFIKYRLQGKCFLWVFWNSCKFAREGSIMKSFDYASKKISLYIFGRMLGKLLFMKVLENYQKNLVAFLLKNSSCPIHPPITIPKTDFTSSVSFVCSGNFQNCWESVSVGITF